LIAPPRIEIITFPEPAKSNKNVNDERKERKQLEQALQINKPPAEANYLKEELGQPWLKNTREEVEAFLTSRTTQGWSTTIQELRKVVKTMLGHCSGILN